MQRGFLSALRCKVGFFVLCFASYILVGCSNISVSDQELETRFTSHRSEFTELLVKSARDQNIRTIAITSTQPNELHVSATDWKRYQELFKTLGIREGMSRDEDEPSTLHFIVYGQGGALAGDTKGYIYSEKVLPTQAELDSLPDGIAYKKLTQNWYIYRLVW